MNVHEYQGKEILRKYGVATPRGVACFSVDEAVAAAEQLGGSVWVVKAQIHAGGRGKGGGVKVATSMEQVREYADAILGMQLVTHQTGPEGKEVKRLYIEEGADIADELYIGALVDRETQQVVLMCSSEGGMDIETVAEETPEKILKIFVDPDTGLDRAEAENVCQQIGIPSEAVAEGADFLAGLYEAFVKSDASLAEINPLVITGDNRVIALDAKFNIDSNALFRQPEIVEYRDLDEEDANEIEASQWGLSYISLDGNIGCLVNGAGLAMATMDIIKLYGGEPANFLDVGGGADKEQVTEAFKIMLGNDNVQGILVNIFGGIMRCDTIAEGIVAAAQEVGLNVPLVVRLEGTNVQQGRKILDDSDVKLQTATTMADAAAKITAAVSA
ncbi:MAG: ADP-forming succinate--CoA ligase subunit beta [Gammaproteobacteria bacterium]|nr:ADP-forming succinate--CoA ligase subunit beta [Gammaproteobacteria bacterium]